MRDDVIVATRAEEPLRSRLQRSLKNVVKSFGSFIGVKDMTLDIVDEEFLVLLGPSGCGKCG